MNRLCGTVYALFLPCALVAATPTPTFYSFNGTDGALPLSGLVQDNQYLYGTAYGGGADRERYGTVYRITTDGELTTLHSFDYYDGAYPDAGSLVQATNGNLYGTTLKGGTYGDGTVFEITVKGKFTSLHSFDSADGENPVGALIQAVDGNLYGTTALGGAYGYGTVFEITLDGTFTLLHSFDSADGINPNAGLAQGSDGNLYGTTAEGGAGSSGTVFQITPSGTLTTIYSFCLQPGCADGANPYGVLALGSNGNFYGTTEYGGSAGSFGTVFEITLAGLLTTLHTFASTDGANPYPGLVLGSDGNFYGTTFFGGTNNFGTIFEITPGGTFTSLYSFSASGGVLPAGALVQDTTNGLFYGTTESGGTSNEGTYFEVSLIP
jgi:uncharacterized repeat protein (TIGR03803 family)